MLAEFAKDLLDGRPVLIDGRPSVPTEGQLAEGCAVIERFERDYRLELPGDPPELERESAQWALKSVYLACALTVHRDAGPKVIEKLLEGPEPDRGLVASHYSVDLTFRFLPDVFKLAKSASSDDPLLVRLREWARDWPLSSVGMLDLGDVEAAPLHQSDTLIRLYVDRILAKKDLTRLADPAVQKVAGRVLGDHPGLAPEVARALADSDSPA